MSKKSDIELETLREPVFRLPFAERGSDIELKASAEESPLFGSQKSPWVYIQHHAGQPGAITSIQELIASGREERIVNQVFELLEPRIAQSIEENVKSNFRVVIEHTDNLHRTVQRLEARQAESDLRAQVADDRARSFSTQVNRMSRAVDEVVAMVDNPDTSKANACKSRRDSDDSAAERFDTGALLKELREKKKLAREKLRKTQGVRESTFSRLRRILS